MAGDFHNAAFPPDVNDDGKASVVDLLGVITALRNGGPRALAAAGGEGEEGAGAGASLYVDVNADNFLSVSDALDVIYELRGEGEAMPRDDNFDLTNPNDPFTIDTNSTLNTLPVLANDSPSGFVTVTRVGTLQGGVMGATSATEFGGTVSVQGAGVGNSVSYTPPRDFFGRDRFVYEVRDTTDNTTDTAVVTVFVQPGPNDVFVRYTYQLFDPDTGLQITEVEQGETFGVRAFIQDVRDEAPPPDDRGVVQGYLDFTYDASRVTLLPDDPATNPNGFNREFFFGPDYQDIDENGDGTPDGTLANVDGFIVNGNMGLIDEAGAVQTFFANPETDPLGPNPVLFFEAVFQANTLGAVTFAGNAADVPEHQTVLSRPSQLDPVPTSAIDYGTLTVNVVAPRGAVADVFNVNEDAGPTTLALLQNDTNVNGTTPLVGTIIGLSSGAQQNQRTITLPSGSTVSINPGDLNVTYTPAANFDGTDVFTYTIRDGSGATDSASVTVNIIPANDAPNAVDDIFPRAGDPPILEGGAQITLDVLANDTDADGDPLTITAVTQPANGGSVQIAPNGLSLLYTPGNEPGETFTYTISDGALTDTATVTVNIVAFDQAVAVDVRLTDLAGNTLPMTGGLTQVNQGQQFRIEVSIQDLRPEEEAPLGLGIFSAFVDLVLSNPNIDIVGPVVFGPQYNNPDFRDPGDLSDLGISDVGSPQTDLFAGPLGAGPFVLFSVIVEADAFGTTVISTDPADEPGHEINLWDPPTALSPDDIRFDAETVMIVNPSAGTPVAVNDAYSVDAGTSLQITTRPQGVLGNDIDPEGDNTIQAFLTDSPDNGMLTLNANGTFTYTPNTGFFGTDTFRYRATDGGAPSNEAVVTITVGANAVDDVFTGNVNQVITGNVLTNDAVPAGSTVTLVDAPDRAANFTLNANGTFTYTPPLNQSFTDTFVYQVAGQTATVTIRVGTPAAAVSGFVYTDEDSSRAMENDERRLGRVTVTLRNNTTGQTFTTDTNAQGAYGFNNVPAGQYTISAEQPMFMIDGWDTVNGTSVVGDSMVINVNGTPQRVDFGELGLRAEFVTPRDFFGQADRNGFQIATNAGSALGNEHWFSFLDGWDNFARAEATVSPDGSTATIRVTTAGGQVFTLANINIDSDPRVRLMGRMGNGVVLRFEGTPAQFSAAAGAAQAAEGEAEGEYEGAVDQIFAAW